MTVHKLEILVIGRDQASGPLSGIKSALGGVGTVAGGILAAGIFTRIAEGFYNMAGGAAEFIKESVFSAARVEEMNAVLETLEANQGLAAGTTDQMVESIKELGITTQSAQWVTAQFVRWQLDSSKATDLARLAQDAAVISMQDSSDALQGLMHGITTMNTRVLRTYGITLASTIDAQEKYAETLGKTRSELDETERIQAVLNAVLEQGSQISGAYEAAMGTAGKQMRSMKRHVVELMNSLGTPLLEAFSDIIGEGTDWLKVLRGAAEEGGFLNRIVEWMAQVFRDGWAALQPFLNLFKTFIDTGSTGSLEFKEALSAIIGPETMTMIQNIVGFFKRLGEEIGRLREPAMNLFNALRESGPHAKEQLGIFVDWFRDNFWPTLKNIIDNLSTLINNLAELWREHGDTIITVVRTALQFVMAIVAGVVQTITGIWSAFTSILRGDWEGAWNTIVGVIETLAQNILSIMGSSLEELRETWAKNFEMFITIIVLLGQRIYQAGRDFVQGLWNGIRSMWDRLKKWVESKVKELLGVFGDILDLGSPSKTLKKYGQWMMQGLAQGIDAGSRQPAAAMAGLGPDLMRAAPGPMGGGQTLIHIEVNGARDPGAVADEIMRRLRRQGVTLGQ